MLEATKLKVEQAVKMYQEGISIRKSIKILKTGGVPIYAELRKRGLLKTISQHRTKYTINHDFFSEINSESSAYFLGLLYADGNLNMNHSSYQIRLTSKDAHILKDFLSAVGSNAPIRTEFQKHFKKEICKVQLTSSKMYSDLCFHGCVPRKSLIITFPKTVHPDYIHHFIRGYFDGDGTVGVYKTPTAWMKLSSAIYSGSGEFMKELVKYLPTVKRTATRLNRIWKGEIHPLWAISLSVGDSIKLCQYMYKDSTIYLHRKKKIFDDFIKQRCSTTTIDNPHKWRIKV